MNDEEPIAQAVLVESEPEVVPVLDSVDDYLKFLHAVRRVRPSHRQRIPAHLASATCNLQPIWDSDTHRALPMTAEDTERLAKGFLTEAQWKQLNERGDVDFAYSPEFGRFPCLRRSSAFGRRHGLPHHQYPHPLSHGTRACPRRFRTLLAVTITASSW